MTTSKLAYEAAFPDGFVTSVNYVVPEELSDIAEKLEALDVEDEDAVAEVRAEIKGIEAGDYTFRFTVDGGGNSLWRISNRRSVFRLMQ